MSDSFGIGGFCGKEGVENHHSEVVRNYIIFGQLRNCCCPRPSPLQDPRVPKVDKNGTISVEFGIVASHAPHTEGTAHSEIVRERNRSVNFEWFPPLS